MRQIREILRQKWCLGQSHQAVAESLRIGSGTVGTTVLRARAAGLDWAQVETLTDEILEARVYGPPTPPTHHRVVPDCAYLHAERRKPGVTLELLHLEYLARAQVAHVNRPVGRANDLIGSGCGGRRPACAAPRGAISADPAGPPAACRLPSRVRL